MRLSDIRKQLTKNGYLPNDEIVMAAYGALHGVPLLVESDPGQGKTSLALAMGQAFGLSVLRVQFYEGLTADKILYDYNYQRQLLSIQAIQSTLAKNLDGKTINEAMDVAKTIDFYGKDFLIRRPVLESIWGEQRYVLLFDEVDKASEELEYTLLEFLDDFSLSIPQYGTVKAKEGMASCLYQLQSLCLKQIPSISEGITWAAYLQKLIDDKDFNIADSLCMLCKNKEDQMRVRDAGILSNVKELS
nr:MoxR family ATPase [uncultured Anaerobutyricum sp.]